MSDSANTPMIRTVAVIGAGTMGHGIAHVSAASGYTTLLHDVSADAVALGLSKIERNLDKGVSLGKVAPEARDATLSRLAGVAELGEIGAADLVIEAAPESMELKRSIFWAAYALSNAVMAVLLSAWEAGWKAMMFHSVKRGSGATR